MIEAACSGTTLPEELLRALRGGLPPCTVPRKVTLLDELPLNAPSGVPVVTAVQPEGPTGCCTANAVMSLLPDPPSLLISLITGSRKLSVVPKAGAFAVNLLAWSDRYVAQRFATDDTEPTVLSRHGHHVLRP